jgi:DNA replication protein DnaC
MDVFLQHLGTNRCPTHTDKTVFSFDHMFDEDSSTLSVYDEMVRPIVWGVSNGKHGSVFCYGQTGSGKTFTMQGNDLAVRQVDGVLQLAAKDTSSGSTNSRGIRR